MTSMRVRWAQKGGYPQGQSFPRQLNEKYILMDHKRHQKMTQRCRLSVAVAAKLVGEGTNTPSNKFGLDYLIHSDHRTRDDWTEISNAGSNKRTFDKEDANSEKLDQWMRDSVVEIVSNIGEAPLLLHIYSDDERKESSSKTSNRLVIEKAVAESWPIIKGRWKVGSPVPNGVILVEELKSKEEAVSHDEEDKWNVADTNNQLHSTTKTWGVLIQAKGLNYTACYILRTCRVQTFFGVCTHFYLVRVNCFVENADTQLKKMWLQR
ncbi:hypothetical protein RHGRI_030598 [Rhododendron griersonianum]|uniref:DUF7804 domain-containing protein n=1 Tax=Rhododendron griersonianum TaxID=479676 RepID=A0AAV6ITW6_9ERIC|nr:hypothetical protein RHGRI_030598 [Rhododendron griersonianum]